MASVKHGIIHCFVPAFRRGNDLSSSPGHHECAMTPSHPGVRSMSDLLPLFICRVVRGRGSSGSTALSPFFLALVFAIVCAFTFLRILLAVVFRLLGSHFELLVQPG